ncbi:MAG: fibronectin type III domain-containing protein, partial [Bacillota bacterium]|nr:fibronectin type III domain-containing protein [Bacillota bacterium]
MVSFRDGNKNIEYNTDLKYDDNAYHFKMQATANADLDGDGTDELVVGGFKNTGYSTRGDDRGEISDSEYLVNVLLYEDGEYHMAWNKPQVTVGIDLDHSREMDAPVAMAAGKYRMQAVADTVFLEGTYLDFCLGSGNSVNEKIKNGAFKQNTSENMSGLSNATINLGASGTFVSDKPANEEVVFYTTHDSGDVDIDIRWGHPGEGGKVDTNIINDNYVDDTEEDDGTIISMCPVNVDQDTSMIKYRGKTVGWSNPVVYGILMSMPYWQEMDYGDIWNARGQTDFGITKSKEDGTTVTAGVDVGATINISGEVTVFGNGVGAGIDIGPVGSYAYENSESKSLSKGITWSVGGGQDSAALMVMPVVTYEYDVIMPKHEATKEEQAAGKSGTIDELVAPLACTTTFEPVITDLSINTYNDVIEEFNAMAEASGNSQDKLPLIDLEEIYADAKIGDPSSYEGNPKDISSLEGEEGKGYYYVGEVHAQTGKDKSVETLSIETTNSSSESNGFTAGLKTSVMGKVIGGLDLMSIVSATGSVGLTIDSQVVGGKTWISTESTGITYSGAFANLPSEAEGYGYEYSAGLVKWNADLEGFDQELEVDGTDEILPDKTVVIAPVVTMLDDAAPPAVPTNLHVLGVTSDSAMLEWTKPTGKRAPDYYKIYYSKDDNSYYPLDGTVGSSETTHLITGLNADSDYYFRIESYDKDTSLRSVKSAPVAATTKSGSEPTIVTHPKDCYAKVGEKALFNIDAKAHTEGNTISYQWQKLTEGDYGISWSDINVASDDTIGRTAEFNAAYASPDGLIRTQDVNNLDGNVYRCVVAEHQSGKLDYIETVSNSATLHVGDNVQAAERVLKIEAARGEIKSDSELLSGVGDDIDVSAVLTDYLGNPLSDYSVKFALLDNGQSGKCIKYLDGSTDSEGKVSISFEDVAAGSYEIIAVVKKNDTYKVTVSNSIKLTVNESYDIVYELNGGINHNLNPVKYATGTKYILLRDASRAGYEFTGWYLDVELKNKINAKWFDVSEHNDVLILYAGWKEIEDDPTDSEKPDDPNEPGTPEDDGQSDKDNSDKNDA